MAEVKDKVISAESLKCAIDALRKAVDQKASGTVSLAVNSHNTAQDAHGDIRKLVDDLATNFSSIVDTYILNINYDENLKFDTSELVISGATSPILGQGMLGYMVLA